MTSGQNKNGVIHWDDIPYAEPPVGDLGGWPQEKQNIKNY